MPLISNTSLIPTSSNVQQAVNNLQNQVNSIISGGGGGTGSALTASTVSSSTTISGWNQLVTAFANTGNITLTLPTSTVTGQVIEVIKMDSTANTVTIAPSSGTINGLQSVTLLYNQYDSISIKAISSNCFVFSGNSTTDDGRTF